MLQCLRQVLDLLRLGDRVKDREDQFHLALESLHEKMLALCPECCKLKPHLMRHIRFASGNFDCFGPERKHKGGKKVCQYSYKNVYKTMLAHDLRDLRDHFSRADTYMPYVVEPECLLEGLVPFIRPLFNVEVVSVYGSRRVFTPKGTYSSGDLLIFDTDTVDVKGVGQVDLFVRVECPSGASIFLAVLSCLQCVQGLVYERCEGQPAKFVELPKVRTSCAYQPLDPPFIDGSWLRLVPPLYYS